MEYARLKTDAVIPDPQENTTLFSLIIPILANFSFIIFFLKKFCLFDL